jgi:Mg2+/Co2+ transporter CorC
MRRFETTRVHEPLLLDAFGALAGTVTVRGAPTDEVITCPA